MGLNGEKTVLFSYEMSAKEIRTRRTSFLSNVYINKLKTGFFTSADIQKINNTCEKIFNTDMLLYDPANLNTFSFNELTALIRIHAKQGYKVFYIDHLGLLELPNEPYLQEYEKISRMTKTLKKLAATLNVCIISLCQLVRDSEGKEPMLNSLRGSGSIEQDANVVIFLHRDRQLKNEAAIPTKVIVAKNRNGGCGSIDFTFEPYTTRFREDNHDSEQNEEPVPIVYKPIKNTEKRAEQALF
jgi:replicative DNA helicase